MTRMRDQMKKQSLRQMKSVLKHTNYVLTLFVVLILWSLAPLHAKDIQLEVGGAEVLRFEGEGVKEVFMANPAVADSQVSNKNTVYLFGVGLGSTKLIALDAKGKEVLSANISVTQNLTELNELIKMYDPHELVEVKAVSSGILLEGIVDTPETAEEIVSLAEKFMSGAGGSGSKKGSSEKSIINRITVKAPAQVNLRVKIAEVSRSIIDQLGFNWQAVVQSGDFKFGALTGRPALGTPITTTNVTGITQPISTIPGTNVSSMGFNFTNSHANINLTLDMLERSGLVTILAEPNLVAVSGETASFLAGGEFPYPVPQSLGQVTVEFKQYGVSLAFTPTILNGKLISMRVRPEVSELDPESGVTVLETTVPGILTRRAETTVQLASGQTFAIAGLLKNTVKSAISSLPGLGQLPVIGALFRSNAFQRGDTELVILVTPYLVEPVSGTEMALPADGLNYASFVEQVFERRLTNPGEKKGESPSFGPGGVRLVGPAGYSVE